MDHEQRHGPALPLQQRGLGPPAPGPAQKVAVAVHHVRIAGDHAGAQARAVCQRDAGCPRPFRLDPRDLGVQAQRAAQALEKRHHARDQRIGAALGEPDAPAPFQRVDQGIDRTGGKRVAAHQQRMEGKGLLQVRVLDEARDDAVDRAVGLQPHQRGRGLQHLAQLQEGHGAEAQVAFLIDLFGIVVEAAVAVQVGGVEAGDLAFQRIGLVHVVEAFPVGPEQPVEGADRQQGHVALHLLPRQRPEFAQRVGIGDDRGARVEDMPLFAPDIGAAARLVAGLQQRRGDARRLQADGEREPAEARADDDGRSGSGA